MISQATKPLVLGTAQLGMNYGVANASGQPDQRAATNIVEKAVQGGIVEFDTAQAYGNSERVLGEALLNLDKSNVKITSKLASDVALTQKKIEESIQKSLTQLNIKSLHSILLHKEADLDHWSTSLDCIFSNLKSSGIIKSAGISVYSPQRALQALETNNIDIIQIPSSLFDQRFEVAGIFEKAAQQGKTLYIRSIFLQGLVFLSAKTLPPAMTFARPLLETYDKLLKKWDMTPLQMALGYAKKSMEGAKIIFGAESPQQVTDNLAAWEQDMPQQCVEDIRKTFADIPEKILNPALWP